MAERIRNNDWENDEEMRQDLEKYVRQNLRREEILDFMIAHYPMYAWSIRSLSRRLQYFGIKYTDYEIDLEDVKRAVKKEFQVFFWVIEQCSRKLERCMGSMPRAI